MNRRLFISSVGTIGAGALAGCLNDDDGNVDGGGEGGPEAEATGVPTETEETEQEDSDGDVEPTEPDEVEYEVSIADRAEVNTFSGDASAVNVKDGGVLADGVELHIEVVDPLVNTEAPARMELTLSNPTGEAIPIEAFQPAPFSIVGFDEELEAGEVPQIVLWNDRYEDVEAIETDGINFVDADDDAMFENTEQRDLNPDESITRSYELYTGTNGLAPGQYQYGFQLNINGTFYTVIGRATIE